MESLRQKAFQTLRTPCVELSSVGLRFKAKQVAVKDVLKALNQAYSAISDVGKQGQLDEKLSEYAFFPLTHVFNESQRLSPRCIEVAAQCVSILVSYGWRQNLSHAMGKQLLLLMSLLSGGDPRKQSQPPTDEVKVAAFDCIAAVVVALKASSTGSSVFDDQSTKNIVDQLFYLLLESVTESAADTVQLSAVTALSALNSAISSRVFLASLLPRTVSALTKALRPTTKARRTHKVLSAELQLLQDVLCKVLADREIQNPSNPIDSDTLDESWMKATGGQVKNALMQVTKLRDQDRPEVAYALENLCLMVIEECTRSLEDSIPRMVETLVVLASRTDNSSARSNLRRLVLTYPQVADTLKTSFMDWTRSLPRLMQSADDKSKEVMLASVSNSFQILSETMEGDNNILKVLSGALVKSIDTTLRLSAPKAVEVSPGVEVSFQSLYVQSQQHAPPKFDTVMLNHQSQRGSVETMLKLIIDLKNHSEIGQLTRDVVNQITDASNEQRLAPLWLAINLLGKQDEMSFDISDVLLDNTAQDMNTSRSYLLNDLFTATFPLLEQGPYAGPDQECDWRLIALTMECVVLNAERYPKDSYRPELMDTLYPILSFLGSSNSMIRSHATTAVNRLASTCQYPSAAEMLIDNVDYLVNSVAWKLNTFNLSPEAPQILRMMVRLCGARLIPYLDDLIQSIFAALDNYHGYPEWVELLFDTLKSMVDESVKSPALAITDGKTAPLHIKQPFPVATKEDILDDLRARKRRKLAFDKDPEKDSVHAPQRPWTGNLENPREASQIDELNDTTQMVDENAPDTSSDPDKEKALSKPHQLLLSIANSTAPHLASPSPRVRHLLLDLLTQISPLLSRDEDSFLPLINSIWPVIIPRLFATQATQSEISDDNDGETAYNICAAADTVAILCQTAGDFMSSRIDGIFAQLTQLFRRVHRDVEATNKPRAQHQKPHDIMLTGNTADPPSSAPATGRAIQGTVDLHLTRPDHFSTPSAAPHPSALRTTSSQILRRLATLLVSILNHVRLSPDHGDEVTRLLAPLADGPGSAGVRAALGRYNADALWVLDRRRRGGTETRPPVLRGELAASGVRLSLLDF